MGKMWNPEGIEGVTPVTWSEIPKGWGNFLDLDGWFSLRARGIIMARQSLLGDIWGFLRIRKVWWLLPTIIVLLLMGVLAVASQVPYLAPFIYALF